MKKTLYRFKSGHDEKADMLFVGIADKDGRLWIQIPNTDSGLGMDKKFWQEIETHFIGCAEDTVSFKQEDRLIIKEGLKLIRKGLELMDKNGLG